MHQRLAEARPRAPVATTAADWLDGLSPAEAIWHLHGAALPLLRLAELPMLTPVDPADFNGVSRF